MLLILIIQNVHRLSQCWRIVKDVNVKVLVLQKLFLKSGQLEIFISKIFVDVTFKKQFHDWKQKYNRRFIFKFSFVWCSKGNKTGFDSFCILKSARLFASRKSRELLQSSQLFLLQQSCESRKAVANFFRINNKTKFRWIKIHTKKKMQF